MKEFVVGTKQRRVNKTSREFFFFVSFRLEKKKTISLMKRSDKAEGGIRMGDRQAKYSVTCPSRVLC